MILVLPSIKWVTQAKWLYFLELWLGPQPVIEPSFEYQKRWSVWNESAFYLRNKNGVLCIRLCSKWFLDTNAFRAHMPSWGGYCLLSPFYRWWNWGSRCYVKGEGHVERMSRAGFEPNQSSFSVWALNQKNKSYHVQYHYSFTFI